MLRCSPRYVIVSWLRLGAVLAVVTPPAIAWGQAPDRTTQDRLDRIERDLNMLERQVYRGAPTAVAPGVGGAGTMSAADIEVRMERLEAQMRDLTGRVEGISNGLDQLKQRVEQVNSDIDVRLSETGGMAAGAPPPSRSPIVEPGRLPAGPAPSASAMPPGTVVPPPPGGGGLNPIFNTLSPPGSAPPRPSAAEPASGEGLPAAGSINEQFNHAFGLVKQADYSGAETALKAFIEAHPNDPLAGDAQYWLGQTYFARNKFSEAVSAFAEGYKRFPKGRKAPENLLYLGMSLAKSDQKKNACVAFAQLDQAFPNPAPAIRERASTEKKRIGCG
jgi:tol-pal system protein YbgF